MRDVLLVVTLWVLVLAAAASAEPVRFDRHGGRLWADGVTARRTAFDRGGVAITIEVDKEGRESIHLYSSSAVEEWRYVSLDTKANGSVELSVGVSGDAGTETFIYPDFESARVGPHWEAVASLLIAMGEERLLCSETFIRWRDGQEVFEPDGEMVVTAEFYLPLLDDPDFRVRERAAGQLSRLGEAGAFWLWSLDPDTLPPETRLRIACILSCYPL